jgi:hypothetical protein
LTDDEAKKKAQARATMFGELVIQNQATSLVGVVNRYFNTRVIPKREESRFEV